MSRVNCLTFIREKKKINSLIALAHSCCKLSAVYFSCPIHYRCQVAFKMLTEIGHVCPPAPQNIAL